MDLNGSEIKKDDFLVKFITKMYDQDIAFEDLTIQILSTDDKENVSEVLELEELLKAHLTAKQFATWKAHATDFTCEITDAEGKSVEGIKFTKDDNNNVTFNAVSTVKSGNYNVAIAFKDDRTKEEGLFKFIGKVSVEAASITPAETSGYWNNNVAVIKGYFDDNKEPKTFNYSADLNDLFKIEIPESIKENTSVNFELVRTDFAANVTIDEAGIITLAKTIREDGDVKENLIGKELEFRVIVKNGDFELVKETFKLKFLNPLQNLTQNTVDNKLVEDTKQSINLLTLLSLKDRSGRELFDIKGTTSDRKLSKHGQVYLKKDENNYPTGVTFEIVTSNTPLEIAEDGVTAKWNEKSGIVLHDKLDVTIKVMIEHDFGTSECDIVVTLVPATIAK